MKKTLITAALAVAMVPVTSAATSDYPETLKSLNDFNTLPGYCLDVYNNDFSVDTSTMGLTATDGFSLSFYMYYDPISYTIGSETKPGNQYWKDALTLTFGDKSIRLEMNGSGDNTGKLTIYGDIANNAVITGSAVTGSWVHIGMSFEGSTLTTYVNGNQSTPIDLGDSYVLTGITDGSSSHNPGIAGQIRLDDVAVFASALSAADYSAMPDTRSIPEPATATLSLLALAGLAARRRRK